MRKEMAKIYEYARQEICEQFKRAKLNIQL